MWQACSVAQASLRQCDLWRAGRDGSQGTESVLPSSAVPTLLGEKPGWPCIRRWGWVSWAEDGAPVWVLVPHLMHCGAWEGMDREHLGTSALLHCSPATTLSASLRNSGLACPGPLLEMGKQRLCKSVLLVTVMVGCLLWSLSILAPREV